MMGSDGGGGFCKVLSSSFGGLFRYPLIYLSCESYVKKPAYLPTSRTYS